MIGRTFPETITSEERLGRIWISNLVEQKNGSSTDYMISRICFFSVDIRCFPKFDPLRVFSFPVEDRFKITAGILPILRSVSANFFPADSLGMARIVCCEMVLDSVDDENAKALRPVPAPQRHHFAAIKCLRVRGFRFC